MVIRSGYTLIELIAALIASTVLIAALAATVAISNHLLDVPSLGTASDRDRAIADRLAADLRYATEISQPASQTFQIKRPDPTTGSTQTINYAAYTGGLTRSVGAGNPIVLDPDAVTHAFSVDGYTAPTTPADKTVRWRSTSTAASIGSTSNLLIDLPHGCKQGDLLLLCVTGRDPNFFSVTPDTWNIISNQSAGDLNLSVLFRFYSPSTVSPVVINVTPSSSLTAAIAAFENVYAYPPVHWSGTDSGFTLGISESDMPGVVEPTTMKSTQMNVQVIAATRKRWHAGTLGLASFTDVAQDSTTPGDSSLSASIGIAVRNGSTPTLTTTPRVRFNGFSIWLQTGICLEAGP